MCREKLEDDAMKRKPYDKNASMFANGLGLRAGVTALTFTVVAMVGFCIGRFAEINAVTPSLEAGRTMAYVTLAMASVINIMSARSFTKSLFTIGFKSNPLLSGAICLSLSLIACTALVPGLREVFYCVPLSAVHWLIMIALALVPFVVVEVKKLIIRGRYGHI
jgi:Ca2+-transporting ATPase